MKAKSQSQVQSSWRKWGALLVLSLALAIIVIDTTILNVSIRNIIQDLHTDIQGIQWVTTIYSLVIAALTITGGRLGDLWGRKKMLLVGAVIFAAGSLTSALSGNIWVLLLGWSVLEGIGAALMMPATASLVVANFHGRDRAVAFGVWGGVAAAASAIGPILGGFLTTNYSWHWAFLINVFVVIVLLSASFLVKESLDTKEKHKLDIVGVFLSALGMMFAVFGIIESSTYGWLGATKPFEIFGSSYDLAGLSITPITVVIGLILLAVFVWWEIRVQKQGRTPLVSIDIFKNQQFSSGIVTTTVMSLGQTGLIFAIPIFLQAVRGLDAFDTGVAMLPLSVSLLIAAPLSAKLSQWVKPKYIIQIGIIVNILAVFVLRDSLSVTTTATGLAPAMLIYGAGMGLVMAQISNLTLSAVDAYQIGEASGVNSTSRQVGATLGSAIIGAVFLSVLTTSLVSGINQSTVLPQPMKEAVVSAVNTQGSDLEFGGFNLGGQQNLPAPITSELTNLVQQATVDANKQTLLVGAGLSFLTLLVSLGLPNTEVVRKKMGEAPLE